MCRRQILVTDESSTSHATIVSLITNLTLIYCLFYLVISTINQQEELSSDSEIISEIKFQQRIILNFAICLHG